jgi:hypothetical protein
MLLKLIHVFIQIFNFLNFYNLRNSYNSYNFKQLIEISPISLFIFITVQLSFGGTVLSCFFIFLCVCIAIWASEAVSG